MSFVDKKSYISILNPKWDQEQENCLVRKFFEEEDKKPAPLRQNHCMISCPCKNCFHLFR